MRLVIRVVLLHTLYGVLNPLIPRLYIESQTNKLTNEQNNLTAKDSLKTETNFITSLENIEKAGKNVLTKHLYLSL